MKDRIVSTFDCLLSLLYFCLILGRYLDVFQ